MTGWHRLRAELSDLREELVAEFADRAVEAPTQLLASFATRRGCYELRQAPNASAPELLLLGDGRPGRLVDFAVEAAEHDEFLIGDLAITEDGRLLAYTVDLDGSDRHELRVLELPDAATSRRTLRHGVGPAVGWHGTNLIFTELDQAMSPRLAAAISPAGDCYRVLCRAAAGEYLDLTQASDGRTVVLSRNSHAGNSLLLLRPGAAEPVNAWKFTAGERVQFDTAGELDWLLCTGPGGPDRLLLRRPAADWQLRCTATPGVQWEQLVAIAGVALLVEREGGGQRLRAVEAGSGEPVDVDFGSDEPTGFGSFVELAALSFVPGFDHTGGQATVVRDRWQSPARPYRVCADRRRAHPMDVDPPAATAPAMRVVRLTARSADQTGVPLTVLGPVDRPPPWPTVLYGYGAYGVALDPGYSPFRLSLLQRGVAFAIAHVRGGGDAGQAWHDAGRLGGKVRAIEDYLACAQHLVGDGWSTRAGLVARSRSAGAAVVAAAINRAPELFAAAVLEVPFVDCLRTLSDPDAALTELEWAEWGNPLLDDEARAQIATWSPVDNVRPAPYPAMLVTSGLADARVSPDEPRRYCEAVRACTTSGQPVILKEGSSGHLGHSNVDEDWYDEADVLAFILDRLGRAHSVPATAGRVR